MTLDDCDTLFARVQATTSPAELTPLFEQLLAACPVIRVGVTRGSIYWRARPCGPEGHANIRDVTYPPAHLAALNRLSDQKQPRFYASARKETALLEQAECKAGGHFHVLGSWVKYGHEIRALVLGEQHHVYKMGYWRTFGVDPGNTLSRQMNARPRSEALPAIYIDAFLGEILSDPLARNSDYVRSRGAAVDDREQVSCGRRFLPERKGRVGHEYGDHTRGGGEPDGLLYFPGSEGGPMPQVRRDGDVVGAASQRHWARRRVSMAAEIGPQPRDHLRDDERRT